MKIRLSALCVAALLAVAAVPTLAASDATIGDFVIKLAKSRNLASTDARVASDALRGVGIRIPADLDYSDPLTEGDVVRLSRLVGLSLTSAVPDSRFDSDQVDRFFLTFGADIGFHDYGTGGGDAAAQATGNGNSARFDPYGRGRRSANGNGKKKGHNKTPKEPN